MTSTINSVIQWNCNDNFDIVISPTLRKVKVDSMTGYKDGFMMINFMDEESVRIDYPSNLDNLPNLIETKLLQWDGWKRRKFLNAYFFVVVVDYIKEHLNDIKDAISMMNEKRCDNS